MFFKRYHVEEKGREENIVKNESMELTQEEIERIKIIPFLEWMRGRKGRLWKWGTLYVILLVILVTQVKLVYLTSESIPYKYCVQFYNLKPEKGDLCVFDYYPKGKTRKESNETRFTFIKYIAGVAGDYVKREGNKIYVNGKLIGEAKGESELHPIDSIVIPKGYVFVKGTHKDSLDSRYKEFGLVKEEAIKGKAIGWLKR